MAICYSMLSHVQGETYYKNRSKTKYHIKDILNNYWDPFIENFSHLNIRDVVFKEVEKVRKCRTIDLGYTMYECSHCDNYIIVPHTCKSRFCSSCGSKYVKTRVLNSKHKFMNVKHRHIVFTIPESIRNIFLNDRDALNDLFDSVNETFTWMFNPVSYQNKEKKKDVKDRVKTITRINKDSCLVPGFICVLHTYGRDLKWNPHIHVLISEGGLTNQTMNYKAIKHFNYKTLRKTFQKILLDKLQKRIGRSFYTIKCKLYQIHNNGFYVYAHPKQFNDIQKGIEYVMRYSGKPAMAESRIINIDYDKDTITYWYDDHKTGKRITITEHVYKFIAKLIRHIPDEQFKTIRYYGLYSAKNHKYQGYFSRLYKLEKIRELKTRNNWRHNLMDCFNYDPITCECGHIMNKTYSYIPIQGSEDEWHEIKYSKEPWKESNWEHFKKYSPSSY